MTEMAIAVVAEILMRVVLLMLNFTNIYIPFVLSQNATHLNGYCHSECNSSDSTYPHSSCIANGLGISISVWMCVRVCCLYLEINVGWAFTVAQLYIFGYTDDSLLVAMLLFFYLFANASNVHKHTEHIRVNCALFIQSVFWHTFGVAIEYFQCNYFLSCSQFYVYVSVFVYDIQCWNTVGCSFLCSMWALLVHTYTGFFVSIEESIPSIFSVYLWGHQRLNSST